MQRLTLFALHLVAIIALTALTQIGGFAYLVGAVAAARIGAFRGMFAAFITYAVATAVILPALAPAWGRVALTCSSSDRSPLKPNSILYCILNRHYVSPQLRAVLDEVTEKVTGALPGSTVTYLDAGFPVPAPMPFLPHLSHRNGRAVDLALFYEGRSTGGAWPLGYFAFAPASHLVTERCTRTGVLRWSAPWLQTVFARTRLDRHRTAALASTASDHPIVDRIFLHPDLKEELGLMNGKIRFAGCNAARHDDHLHVEIAAPASP